MDKWMILEVVVFFAIALILMFQNNAKERKRKKK